jgi:hypothetical protein
VLILDLTLDGLWVRLSFGAGDALLVSAPISGFSSVPPYYVEPVDLTNLEAAIITPSKTSKEDQTTPRLSLLTRMLRPGGKGSRHQTTQKP